MTTLITDIETEIWDKANSDEAYEETPASMAVTIYNGGSDSPEFKTLDITEEEATQITGKSGADQMGFTEWNMASRLLFMNLPERIDDWAIETIAGYIDLTPDQVRYVRVAALAASKGE